MTNEDSLMSCWRQAVLQLLIKFWVQGSFYLHCIRCAITATHLPYFMVCSTHKFQKLGDRMINNGMININIYSYSMRVSHIDPSGE